MSTIYLVQGDTGPQIKLTVTREDTGYPVDVSGGSALLKVRKKGSSTLAFTLTSQDVGDNFENGVCLFSLSGGQLATIDAGNYQGELEITLSDATVETVYEEVDIVIREDF